MSASHGKGIAALLSAMLATQAVATWSVLALAAIAPMVADEFGLPAVFIGYQITIIYFVATAVSLIAGLMVGRLGACRTSQVCLLACAVGCLVAALPSLAAIALASAAIGFAYGLTNPSSAQLLARYTTPANRSLIFSIKQTGVPVGGMLAGIATPWLAAQLGWQIAVAVIAPAALVLAALLQTRRARWDDADTAGAAASPPLFAGLQTLLRHRALQLLSLCGFFFGAIQLCLMTFIVTYAVVDLSFGPVLAGWLLATAQAGGIAGRLSWGYLADHLQNNAAILIAVGLLTALCCVLLGFISPQSPDWMVFAVMLLLGASAIGWNGVFVSETVRLSPPAMISSMVGVTTFCIFVGVLTGPSMFILLYGISGSYATVFAILAVPALLGTLSIAISRCLRD